MNIISLLVILVIIGVVMYLLNTLVPIDPRFRTIINAVVIICVLLWVLQQFGLLTGVPLHLR